MREIYKLLFIQFDESNYIRTVLDIINSSRYMQFD